MYNYFGIESRTGQSNKAVRFPGKTCRNNHVDLKQWRQRWVRAGDSQKVSVTGEFDGLEVFAAMAVKLRWGMTTQCKSMDTDNAVKLFLNPWGLISWASDSFAQQYTVLTGKTKLRRPVFCAPDQQRRSILSPHYYWHLVLVYFCSCLAYLLATFLLLTEMGTLHKILLRCLKLSAVELEQFGRIILFSSTHS